MNARATHTRHCLPPAVAASPVASVSVSQMTRPNGITTTWSYEQNRDLVTQVQNGTVSTYGYTNDAIGRRTSMSRLGSAYANPDTISYTYNDRSELTGASSNVDTTYSYSYAYDPIGNRITANEAGIPWTYTANNLNQYTSATENNMQLDFAYDLDGSMTYRPVDATGGWTQIWNGENRMVETFKGNDRLIFKYDYMGRRVEKCVYSGNTLTSKTLFVYDGFKCVEELDAVDNNAVLMRHTWQPFNVGLDAILATTDGNGSSYFLHDANKNIVAFVNTNVQVASIFMYGPFGRCTHTGTMSSSFSFSSEFFDKETEQMYYNYRYYCPPFGRWLSRDPIGEITSRQLLAFNNNNSLLFFDFLGLGTLPSFHFTGPECCDDLRKHIEDLEKELRKRNKDLHDDKDLFGNPDATPRREGGKGTWEGHREMHQIVYNRLKKEIQNYLEKCDDNVPPGAQGLLKYLDEVHEINGPDVPDRIKNPQPIQPIPDPVLPQFPSRPFPNPNYYLPIFIIPIMIVVIILIPVGA